MVVFLSSHTSRISDCKIVIRGVFFIEYPLDSTASICYTTEKHERYFVYCGGSLWRHLHPVCGRPAVQNE